VAVLVGILPLGLSFSSHRRTTADGPDNAARSVAMSAGPIDDAGPTGSRRSGRRIPARPSTRERRPRPEAPLYPVATKRAPHQFDHTKADARPFIDAIQEVQSQDPNTDASVFDSDQFTTTAGAVIEHPHVETKSLDEVFPATKGFSKLFSSNQAFRNGIRDSMRQDIFNATPAYAGMSEKARRMLLLPDSSLQGSWRCQGRKEFADGELRMPLLTKVLLEYLGEAAPTGDEFMDRIGSLCGSTPQTHWIDIVGITDRRISHSWHQDTGRSPNEDTKTVLFGFPKEDDYVGGGVFSHLVKLEKEQWAPEGHPPNEPVLFTNSIDEKHIVRPQFAEGKEIVIYRDVDVLHSAPDVAYRSSVMRFM
jgi:hypothetical protein